MKLAQSLLKPDGGHQFVCPLVYVVRPLPSSVGMPSILFPAYGHSGDECPS